MEKKFYGKVVITTNLGDDFNWTLQGVCIEDSLHTFNVYLYPENPNEVPITFNKNKFIWKVI